MSFTKYRIYDDYRGTVDSSNDHEEALENGQGIFLTP